jgi:glycogen synthase
MRILMLGWEFPPFISGGLGTACHGLTKALDQRGHQVLFVLPRPVDRSSASHVRVLSPEGAAAIAQPFGQSPIAQGPTGQGSGADLGMNHIHAASSQASLLGASQYAAPTLASAFSQMRLVGLPANFQSPYGSGKAVGLSATGAGKIRVATGALNPDGTPVEEDIDPASLSPEDLAALMGQPVHQGNAGGIGKTGAGAMYRGDLIAESERYARLVLGLARREDFDVIHAHDWLTFPAGIAVARASGKPLVVHVHSTEFDRSGEHPTQRVYDIERRGMLSAIRVIAVSELTKSLCVNRFGIEPNKVDVVYNGIEDHRFQPGPKDAISAKDKIVLFLGRITMQKGPEYFIAAAKRVLEKVPDAKFVMAGAGDMEIRMIELAASLGIGHRVLFAGFLRGADVERMYQMADCYVMPSVSEPFGLAPLEAMRADVPVIISKQSGVSEVLTHALKVDFWDIDEMANKIVAVLKYPPLSQTLRQHGSFELRKLTWETAAEACEGVYGRARQILTPDVHVVQRNFAVI